MSEIFNQWNAVARSENELTIRLAFSSACVCIIEPVRQLKKENS